VVAGNDAPEPCRAGARYAAAVSDFGSKRGVDPSPGSVLFSQLGMSVGQIPNQPQLVTQELHGPSVFGSSWQILISPIGEPPVLGCLVAERCEPGMQFWVDLRHISIMPGELDHRFGER
jgi:hypothetical protein